MKTIELWTIQSIEWYNELLQNGFIHGAREYIKPNWEFSLFGYHWLMNKMDEKIGKRPFLECYPVWAWYQYSDIKRKKPDLRTGGFLPKGEKGVRLKIIKNEKEVLLSDFLLWHFPFSYHSFIGHTEQESVAFEEMLIRKGLDTTNIENLPKHIITKIIKSWDNVLNLDFDDPKDSKSIQATFWTLSLNEVVQVDEFIAR